MAAFGDRSRAINLGDVSVGGVDSFGVQVFGQDASGINFGHITVAANVPFNTDDIVEAGLAAGGTRATLTNFGTIVVHATLTAALLATGDGAYVINSGNVTVGGRESVGIDVSGDGATAVNTGRITVTSDDIVTTGMRSESADSTLTNYGTIDVAAGLGVGMAGAGDGSQIRNFGVIRMSAGNGMSGGNGEAIGAGLNAHVVNAGHIITQDADGIVVGFAPGLPPALTATVENTGVIETHGAGKSGVVLMIEDSLGAGAGPRFTNSGQITNDGGAFLIFSGASVVMSGDGAFVENTRSGLIESRSADSAAVELNVPHIGSNNDPASESARLENWGLLQAPSVAVLGGAGQETVVNHGQIVGDVNLGDGNDTFVAGKGGSLAGELVLGGGDDLVYVEKGSGSLRIADFFAGPAGGDVVDISAFYASFTDLVRHSRQVGNDAVIGLGHNDQLVLENVQLGALDAGDFRFNSALLAPASEALLADAGTTGAGPTQQHAALHSS
jgi:hypothetical protein